MKQLQSNGRYFIALTAIEYVAMPVDVSDGSGLVAVLTAPQDTIYPNSPSLMVFEDGSLYSQEGKLPITTSDLNFTGAYHDWQTNRRAKFRTS